MTREHIIEKIEEYSLKHYSCDPTIKYEWWELSNTDKAGLADELLSMIEQEKKEVAKEVLNDLKGLLEGYIYTNENITLYEYYCKKYGVEL